MDNQYQIVFTADTTNAIAGMKSLEMEFKMLESYINGTGSGLGSMTTQLNNLSANAHGASVALDGAGRSTKGLGDHLMGLATSWIVIDAGTQALAAFGEMANKARDYAKEMAVETMGLRDSMRELANLKKHDGPDNEVAAETLNLGIQAGMLPQEAVKYLEQFEGSSPAGEQKGNIDAKTKAAFAVEGAKFGTRVKLAPQTAGDVTGVLSQYGKIGNVEEGAGKLGKIAYGLNEGRGNLEPLMRSLINTAGAVVGENAGFSSVEELSAMLGVASTHANPREAGTRVRQATRALRDLNGPTGLFLQGAGITSKMGHIERLGKIAPKVAEAEKGGMGADQFLKGQGFTDEDEIRSIVEQVHDLDIVKQRIEAQKGITGKSVVEANERFLRRDRTGIRRKQEATKKTQEFLLGEKNERVVMATDNAETEMRDKGEIGGFNNGVVEWLSDLGGLVPFLGGQKARERFKMDRAEKNLHDEAKWKGYTDKDIRGFYGIEDPKPPGPNASVREQAMYTGETRKISSLSEDERKAGFNRLSTQLERKDANIYGPGANLAPKLDLLVQETRETNRILTARDKAAAGKGQAPAMAAAPMPLVRGAAAPKRP